MEQGHSVKAFVRNPDSLKLKHERLTVVQGNVLDYPSVERAMEGTDAVLSALGHKRWFIPTSILSEGTKNIIAAMKKHSVRRIVCETSLGVADSRGKLGLYYTLFVIPFITFFYFRDKKRQELYIKESGLDWIIVRPGQLTNGKKRGTYRHGTELGNYFLTLSVSRADTADFMLKQLTDDSYLHKTPAVIN
ncbi:MAG: SDR family oxidoreductase [Ignavibacteriales bacterium]|nr:SDR family oxidoreductase [Ignavibacteriales bacterium]